MTKEGMRHEAWGMSAWPRVLVFVVAILAMPVIASACPVCFGNPNSALTKGASNGILFLLAIVGAVQVGFIALFWTFWKRAREFKRHRESFQLIEGGK